MKFNTLLVVLITIICSGCTTMPVSVSKAQSISDDRLYDPYKKYSTPIENGAKIIIVRDSGILGSAGSAALFVNGEIVARVRTGESIILNVKNGDNVLGVGPGTKMSWEKDNVELIEQTLNTEPEKTYYFRITIDLTKGLILQRTSQIK